MFNCHPKAAQVIISHFLLGPLELKALIKMKAIIEDNFKQTVPSLG
jgi:hypothetical protein